MHKIRFSLLHTLSAAAMFSGVSFFYGFMIGRESARKELSDLIESLRRNGPAPDPPSPEHS